VTADPDPLAIFRTGRLGPLVRPPAFASASDPDRLLGAVADALNQCERHGLAVDLEHGAALTTRGYVLPVGDSRLGSRWAVRSRLEMTTGDQQRQAGRVPPEESQ
jgi:hypothetical protein